MNQFLQMLNYCAVTLEPVTVVVAGVVIEDLVIFNVEGGLLQASQNGVEIVLDVEQIEAILGEKSLFDAVFAHSEELYDLEENEHRVEELADDPLENDMDLIYNATLQDPFQNKKFCNEIEESFKGFPAVKTQADKLIGEIFSSDESVNPTPFFQRLAELSSIQTGCETPFSYIKAMIWYKKGKKKHVFQLLKGNGLDCMGLYVGEQLLPNELFFDYFGSNVIAYELPLSESTKKLVEYYVKLCAVYQDVSLLNLWLFEQMEQDINGQYRAFFAAIILYLYRKFKGDDDIRLQENNEAILVALMQEICEGWSSGNTLERQEELEGELDNFLRGYEESGLPAAAKDMRVSEPFYIGWISSANHKLNHYGVRIYGSKNEGVLHISRVLDPLLVQLLLNGNSIYRLPVVFQFKKGKNSGCRCSNAFLPLNKREEYLKEAKKLHLKNLVDIKLTPSFVYNNRELLLKTYGEKNLKNAMLSDDPELERWFALTLFMRQLLDRTVTAETELPEELKRTPGAEALLRKYISLGSGEESKEQEYLLSLVKALLRKNGDEKNADYLSELQQLMGSAHPLYGNDEKRSKEELWKSRILPAVSDGEYSAAIFLIERWKELYRGNGMKSREKGPLWEKVTCLQRFCVAMEEGSEVAEIGSELRTRLTSSELSIIQRKTPLLVETEEGGNPYEI